MYLDTTFCEPKAVFIPSREESAEAAIAISREWLSRSKEHHVHISNKAGIGYEQLYREMAAAFGMKVQTNLVKPLWEKYIRIFCAEIIKFALHNSMVELKYYLHHNMYVYVQ